MFQGTALNVVRVSIEKPEAVAHSQTLGGRGPEPTSAVRGFDVDFVEMGESVGPRRRSRERALRPSNERRCTFKT